jgi:hypothetical protein
MGKRLAIYLGLLGATLALAAICFVNLDASLSDRPYAGWPLREVTGEAQSATRPRTGEGWIHFERTMFVDTQGNFVSAGLIYVVQEPKQVARQPIVRKTYVGIMYRIVLPMWQSVIHGISRPTLSGDTHALQWVDVLQTEVAGPGR